MKSLLLRYVSSVAVLVDGRQRLNRVQSERRDVRGAQSSRKRSTGACENNMSKQKKRKSRASVSLLRVSFYFLVNFDRLFSGKVVDLLLSHYLRTYREYCEFEAEDARIPWTFLPSNFMSELSTHPATSTRPPTRP